MHTDNFMKLTHAHISPQSLLGLACAGLAQFFLQTTVLAAAAPIGPAPAEPVVLERGPFYKIVQTPSGGQYTEMADGLCYQDPEDGLWKDSQEVIEIIDADGTAVARQGQQRVTFMPNINTPGGSIDLRTPDGKRLLSRPMGIVLYDA